MVETRPVEEPGNGAGSAARNGDAELAQRVAETNAWLTGMARAARDRAEKSGTLVWDPFDPAWGRDPYPVYAALRERNPVHRSPLGFWVFTRHADCLAVLRDKRVSSDGRHIDARDFPALRDRELVEGTSAEVLTEMAPFLFRDPPDHTRLRGLVQKAFTPRVVEGLRPRIQEICDELLDTALDRGGCDLVADFAYPLPVQIIVELLGVPAEDHERFRVWSDALARGLDPDFLLPPEAVRDRLNGIISFVQYFAGLIEERRARPADDLVTRLIQAEEQGDVLTQGELLSTCILLLVAGHETTVNLISGGALALMEHPDQLARFRDDPAVTRTGVEEMLRYVGPVQLTGRVALEPIEVGGVTVGRGEFAMVLIGSANRDPAAFTDPDSFDVGRTENPNLGFGFGIHHCLGASLARLEAQVALTTLTRRARALRRLGDALAYKENVVLRGLAELPVEIAAA
ncbi:MAG TPA: cytochrome P450 [Acidimicrobiales bacterium]|nr:cytochrome P450 [Acidimicrobiales bacterium]